MAIRHTGGPFPTCSMAIRRKGGPFQALKMKSYRIFCIRTEVSLYIHFNLVTHLLFFFLIHSNTELEIELLKCNASSNKRRRRLDTECRRFFQ